MRAAEEGEVDAQFDLACAYSCGTGVRRDLPLAVHWYQEAAKLGDRGALANLAYCYAVGKGVCADETRALELYERAAEMGDEESRLSVAACYLHGSGVQADPERGMNLLRELAETSSVAALRLAETLYDGEQVPQNLEEAVHWLERAAAEVPEAVTFLGALYWNGTGLPQDRAKARAMYSRAANLDEPHALYNLGLAGGINGPDEWPEGEDGPVDWELIEQASDMGHGRAAVLLASRWIEGQDVGADPGRGFAFLEPSVAALDPDALCFAADCLSKGIGVEVDLSLAMEYYQLAQLQGFDTRTERRALRRCLRELDETPK